MNLKLIIMAGLGGAIGSSMRYMVGVFMGSWLGRDFPWGTITVNILGSFLMGLLVGLFADKYVVSDEMKTLILVGFLGGFTTFSSFSLDTASLFGAQGYMSFAYVAASLLLGFSSLWGGLQLAKVVL